MFVQITIMSYRADREIIDDLDFNKRINKKKEGQIHAAQLVLAAPAQLSLCYFCFYLHTRKKRRENLNSFRGNH